MRTIDLYEPSFVRDIIHAGELPGEDVQRCLYWFFRQQAKELSVSAIFFNSRPYNGYNISQYERDSELPYLENL